VGTGDWVASPASRRLELALNQEGYQARQGTDDPSECRQDADREGALHRYFQRGSCVSVRLYSFRRQIRHSKLPRFFPVAFVLVMTGVWQKLPVGAAEQISCHEDRNFIIDYAGLPRSYGVDSDLRCGKVSCGRRGCRVTSTTDDRLPPMRALRRHLGRAARSITTRGFQSRQSKAANDADPDGLAVAAPSTAIGAHLVVPGPGQAQRRPSQEGDDCLRSPQAARRVVEISQRRRRHRGGSDKGGLTGSCRT
jgi:hypothetical protein